jgi:ATPase family AAA domain-containing protein 3A/B
MKFLREATKALAEHTFAGPASWVTMLLLQLVVTCVAFCGVLGSEGEPGKYLLYTDIQPANRTESLLKLKSVPIVRYKFIYDSVIDRHQIGIIGPDAQKYFAESIDVVPSQTFTSKDRTKPPAVVTNFPVVDKNVLFMHGLVALQELIFRYEELSNLISSAEEVAAARKADLMELQDRLYKGVSLQAQEKLALAELEAEATKKSQEVAALKEERERVLLQEQRAQERELKQLEAALIKERMQRQEQLERQNAEQAIRMEKELAEKRELLARETNQALQKAKQAQEAELEVQKLEHEKEKIRVEIEAKAAQTRIQQEMELRKIQTQSKLDTERMITAIKTVSAQVSRILRDIFEQPQQVAIVTAVVLALVALYYLFKEAFKLVRQYVQSRIGRPSLVRETSYTYSFLPHAVLNYLSPPEDLTASRAKLESQFENIILSAEDKQRVLNLALATRNTKQSGAPYRHVLLHGSPGTGKTLIARRLAACSGMDYAVMSGGDVAPLGEDAVNQLHGLFKWAARSRKGLLVFIDEAEAFLAARGGGGSKSGAVGSGSGDNETSDVHIRNALNALLYQTGTPSHNFMLVLATNRPQDLDVAVLDRVDVSIPITPPAEAQRLDLIRYYIHEHVVSVAEASQRSKSLWARLLLHRQQVRRVDAACLSEETLRRIASDTEGFSGREIAKMFIAAQYAMFLAENSTLTVGGLMQTVAQKVQEHRIKKGGFAAEVVNEATFEQRALKAPAGNGASANPGRNKSRAK